MLTQRGRESKDAFLGSSGVVEACHMQFLHDLVLYTRSK